MTTRVSVPIETIGDHVFVFNTAWKATTLLDGVEIVMLLRDGKWTVDYWSIKTNGFLNLPTINRLVNLAES